jgi:hypothetical protein
MAQLPMPVHPFQLQIWATPLPDFANLAKTLLNLTVSEATGQ